MTKKLMLAKVTEFKELTRMKEELEAEIEACKDAIRKGMGDKDVVSVGGYKVSNKEVASTRLDTALLKKDLGLEALAPYMKTTVTRRFIVTG